MWASCQTFCLIPGKTVWYHVVVRKLFSQVEGAAESSKGDLRYTFCTLPVLSPPHVRTRCPQTPQGPSQAYEVVPVSAVKLGILWYI